MLDDKKRIKELEEKLKLIQSIPQLPMNASLAEIVIAINKITNSVKRKI